jgi:hypothetical protein
MDAFTRESRRLRDPAEPEFSNSGHCRLLQLATCAVDANLTRDFVDLIKQLPIATTLTGPDKLLITSLTVPNGRTTKGLFAFSFLFAVQLTV